MKFREPKEVKSSVKRIVQHFIKHRQSLRSLEDVCKVVNLTPKAAVKVPTTRYTIKQFIEPSFSCYFHIECPECKQFSKGLSGDIECCGKKLKTVNTNHFVSISLREQLKRSVMNNFDEIVAFESTNGVDAITDVHDSVQFRRIQSKHSCKILSLTVNTDGAAVYKSVFNKSIWPIHLQQNYLSPKNRFKTSNILLAAIFFGPNQPSMHEFFYPMLKEIKEIQEEGGIVIERDGKQFVFMPTITHICCDLPAKAKVQSFIGHSGYHACSYCLHPGVSIKTATKDQSKQRSYVRYIYRPSSIRSHESILNIYQQKSSMPIMGVRDISCMIAATDFDLVNGFVVDYMHCVLLGIVRKLIELWFDSKNHEEPYYISKKYQRIFDHKLCSIKPISEIGVRPVSIFNRSNFKAKTYRTLLLFYLRCCLPGCIDPKYIDHFQMLASSIFVLLKEKICMVEINAVEKKLDEFVRLFEELYGSHNVTMNLHLLRHLSQSVRHSGPLWSNSAFCFESNNGELIRSNNAKLNILQSMAWKYTIKPSIECIDEQNVHENIQLKEKCNINFSPYDQIILQSCGFKSLYEIVTYKILKIRSEKFSSMAAKELQTVDFVVQLENDEKFGAIKYFIYTRNGIYFILDEFKTKNTIDHLREIEFSGQSQIFRVESIKKKLIYIKVKDKQFVSFLPNSYEEN